MDVTSSSISRSRPVSVAPLLCTSAGIFLFIFGLLALLPGRDTASYLASGNARSLDQAIVQPAAMHPRVLPGLETMVIVRGRFYHWDRDCQLLLHHQKGEPLHEVMMTREEAETRGYLPCDFCDRH